MMNRKEELQERLRVLDTEINQLNTQQHAIKILLNSLYGALG